MYRRFMFPACLGLVMASVLFTPGVHAADTTITYQGVLRDNTNAPVPNGLYEVQFSIYDNVHVGSGTQLWGPEVHSAVEVVGGAFSVQLGSIVPFGSLFTTNSIVFLEVAADTGSGLQAFSPRAPLSAAPFAFKAQHAEDAETVGGMSAAAISQEIDDDLAAHDGDANAHPGMELDASQITSGTLSNARLSTGSGSGLDADTVDGFHAILLEESAEIDSKIATHNVDANAHINLQINGGQITSGTIDNARLAMGAGNGLDADTLDGVHAAALEESAEIDADIAAHNTNANAHANLNVTGEQIISGKIANARLNTGSGNGLDADTLDGVHAAALEESAEIDADIALHNTDPNAHNNMSIEAEQIHSGTLDVGRIPVGTGGTQVAAGNHTHHSLTGQGGSPNPALFVDSAGEVGIGTTTPGQRLEVNGAIGFTGAGPIGNQTTGIISRAPRVIHSEDPRGGCPDGGFPANTPLWTVSFTLTNPAVVYVTGDIIRNMAGRADLSLYVAGVPRDTTLTYTSSGQWEDAHVVWCGALPPGTHNVWLQSPSAGVWGCGPSWGSLDIIIFE